MARQDSIVSAPTRGAARTLDASFPSLVLQTQTNTALGSNFISRQTQIQFNEGANTSSGGTSQWVYHNGRVCYRWSGNGLQTNYWKSDATFTIAFPMLASGVGGIFQDDYRCWRIMATLAADNGFNNSADNGLVIGPVTDFNTVVAVNDGVCFRPLTLTSWGVFIRQNNVVTFDQAVASNTDVTQFNTVEFRIIGATSTTDASLKAYYNGVKVQTWSWGAGSILPGFANGISLGWNMALGNRGATAMYMPMAGCRVIAAATEAGLL